MSLISLRSDTKKRNAFLSDCFNFIWLGKYEVQLNFFKDGYKVFCRNFTFHQDGELPYCISHFGQYDVYNFCNIKKAIDFFKLVCYTLISDFDIRSTDDFDEFFDFNRSQGWNEYLPQLHKYLK